MAFLRGNNDINHRWVEGGARAPQMSTVPPQVVVLQVKHAMNTCSTSSASAVLTELRDRDGIKATTDYAGLPSTNEETKALAPLMLPEVLNLKPTHDINGCMAMMVALTPSA